jgi:hypothetical protein
MANKANNPQYQYQKGLKDGLEGRIPSQINPFSLYQSFSAIGIEPIRAYLKGVEQGYAMKQGKALLSGKSL